MSDCKSEKSSTSRAFSRVLIELDHKKVCLTYISILTTQIRMCFMHLTSIFSSLSKSSLGPVGRVNERGRFWRSCTFAQPSLFLYTLHIHFTCHVAINLDYYSQNYSNANFSNCKVDAGQWYGEKYSQQ